MLASAIACLFEPLYAVVAICLILAGVGGYATVVRWRKSESKVSAAPSGVWGLRFHAIAAAVLYVWDALIFGGPGLTLFVMIIFILIGVGQTLMKVLRGQPVLKTPLRNMAIYAICFVAVIFTFRINNEIARSRADIVVSAVKQYKAKYQRYPETLQTMVSEFLPSVPLAKYTLLFNNFRYWRNGYKDDEQLREDAALFYFKIPFFGRPIFGFERDQWGFIDWCEEIETALSGPSAALGQAWLCLAFR
jgi:hypothetical protein